MYVLTAINLNEYSERYQPLNLEQRLHQLYQDFPREEVMLTSAFAATSAMLLHLFSEHAPWQKIHFIDTGYHFPETLAYKNALAKQLNIDIIEAHADPTMHAYTQQEQSYKTDPDLCCSINKVLPLDELKEGYRVWVSGLMRWQTPHRANLKLFDEQNGMIKFFPLLDVTKAEREAYIETYQLPHHPLVAKGYSSIGCAHCTVPGTDRDGRWNKSHKTECGLHT